MSNPRLTAQLHAISERGPANEYLERMLDWIQQHSLRPVGAPTIVHGNNPDQRWLLAEGYNKPRRVPGPWRYVIQEGGGNLAIDLPEPWRLTKYMFGQLTEAGGPKSRHMSGNIEEKKRATIMGSSSLLVRTSKMGCMSWNLPAGPSDLLGTCPGAVPGWRTPFLKVGKPPFDPRLANSNWDRVRFMSHPGMAPTNREGGRTIAFGEGSVGTLALRAHSREEALRLIAAHYGWEKATIGARSNYERDPEGTLTALTVSPRDYICNGCYALKGSYGNFSNVIGMELRRLWVRWCLKHDKQEFVDVMTAAIELSRRRNAIRRSKRHADAPVRSNIRREVELGYPDPDYFRIHDAGDFFSAAYFGMWLQVIDNFPTVRFWAPTRLWFADPIVGAFQRELAKTRPSGRSGVPPNLALRPSALHFGEPPPSIPGLVGQLGGSGAGKPESMKDGSGKPVHCLEGEPSAAWWCPAYRPYTEGGGALRRAKREVYGKGKTATGKTKKLTRLVILEGFEKTGSCQYAKGMTGPRCSGRLKQGCRVCWEQGSVHVLYSEH